MCNCLKKRYDDDGDGNCDSDSDDDKVKCIVLCVTFEIV